MDRDPQFSPSKSGSAVEALAWAIFADWVRGLWSPIRVRVVERRDVGLRRGCAVEFEVSHGEGWRRGCWWLNDEEYPGKVDEARTRWEPKLDSQGRPQKHKVGRVWRYVLVDVGNDAQYVPSSLVLDVLGFDRERLNVNVLDSIWRVRRLAALDVKKRLGNGASRKVLIEQYLDFGDPKKPGEEREPLQYEHEEKRGGRTVIVTQSSLSVPLDEQARRWAARMGRERCGDEEGLLVGALDKMFGLESARVRTKRENRAAAKAEAEAKAEEDAA